jgi:serine/threonine protein kinase
MWTLGVLAYEALTGERVFPDSGNETIMDHANNVRKYPWLEDKLHPAFEKSPMRELIEGCTRRDPKSRLTAQQVLQQMHRMNKMQTIRDPGDYEQH